MATIRRPTDRTNGRIRFIVKTADGSVAVEHRVWARLGTIEQALGVLRDKGLADPDMAVIDEKTTFTSRSWVNTFSSGSL